MKPSLDPSDWARLDPVLEAALERPSEQRLAFVEAACGGDRRLAERVLSLVRAAEQADAFLETPVGEHTPELVRGLVPDEPPLTVAEGVRFGPYRVIRELGRGGMGTVYLAERADERYERRVAIKLVASGTARGFERRFEKERRILASLEHPGIATLYDAGTTPEGTPFLVMEYVEGERIDVYCDERSLPVEERLDLFDQVCAAVEYAHGRLVVHRDLKPSNILVTSDGDPKLLDFGVARLLEADPAEARAEPTTTGLRAMTPEYASPEQLRGDPVTTSSDVWALGVLLYRLLTGGHPYRFESRSPFEVERTLIERRPTRPSQAADSAQNGRGTRLARRLRGDLDNIVLTALRPEPARRYRSVGELRADIRAHLTGFPVSARPDTWRYRTEKFVRRHRVGLLAVALVLLAVIGGLVGVAWQARLAAREAARAAATRDYLVGMFEALDPDELGGRSLGVEELIDLGAGRLEEELGGQPEVRAEVAGVLGRMYQRLGMFEKARPLFESARAELVARHGERHAASVRASSRLVSLLRDQGEFEEAERLARASLAARRELYGSSDTAVATGLSDLAAIRSARGDYEEAEELHRRALAIDRRAGTREAVATDLANLGVVHLNLGEHEEARRFQEEALSIRRELYGDRDTRVAISLLNLSAVLRAIGEYDAAIAMLEECLSIRRERLGDEHPHVALALSHLGGAHQQKGDLDASRTAHLEALEIRRSVLGENHPEVAESLNNLGVVAYFRADYAAAAERFDTVAEIWRDQLGEEHPNVLTVLNNRGAALREAGDLEAAERVLRQVLDLRRRTLGEGHPDVAQSLNNLATLLDARGKDAEAEETFRAAIAGWRASLRQDHPTVAFGLIGLGKLLHRMGRCAEAVAPLREAVALREAALDPASADVAVARYYLGLCELETGRPAEAESLLRAALPALEARWGSENEVSAGARQGIERAVAAQRGGT